MACKRQSKTNRSCSGQAKKPFVRTMALMPHGSRDCQCENTEAHCHHFDRDCEKTKAKREDQSVCGAESKAIQDQKPGYALFDRANSGCDGEAPAAHANLFKNTTAHEWNVSGHPPGHCRT